ncbi:hypothetical protein ACTNEU_01375 [Ellagibacter isourolithinifaciens]|uniref:hypothetical protein n=1 Tax=Ellagibacter isourolithinifaciens TaxID=2137581 RepID=UPI003F89733D
MSRIKSFSVGNGDLFYIEHGSDNFSIIDCNITEDRHDELLSELKSIASRKGIIRFISTHPDEDHIHGIEDIDRYVGIPNFYCVQNAVDKEDLTESFAKYKELRDESRSCWLKKGCSRKWLNEGDDERGSSGITILWPDVNNHCFIDELEKAENTGEPNNISPAVKYSLNDGVTALWLGDMECEYMSTILPYIELPKVDILFAPHHGRKSGRVPSEWLKELNPKVIVIGEAPSEDLEYYSGFNTIKQNTAGDILFDCGAGKVDVFVANGTYSEPFLRRDSYTPVEGMRYIGTFYV